MKVLQFGFDKNEYHAGALKNVFLPHNFETTNCVAYTGTHDNDTTQGLLESLDDETVLIIAGYLTGESHSVESARKLIKAKKLTKEFIKAALASTASIAIIPFQDIYALGSSARMNMPSTSGANWSWRADENMISGEKADKMAAWLKNLNIMYAR